MNNEMYDPQAESLKVYWASQQERLRLLSGMTITNDILNLTSSCGESEIMAFEKLMRTQKSLVSLLNSSTPSAASAAAAEIDPSSLPGSQR